jgi:glycosyltransferase involved in cell wall biosynthesis
VTIKLDSVAVVIPALNEEESLPHVLHAMPKVGRVFVVDNGSTDSTAEVAAAAGATVLSQPARGYGRAAKTGIEAAAAAELDIVVILDADHSFEPAEISRLVAPILKDKADMVLGDRTRTAVAGALTPPQRFGNRIATQLIYRISGHRYRDMGPFRAIRTHALIAMDMGDPNYGWNVEMQMKALQHGLRVLEVDVSCRPRVAGESKISGSVRSALRCGAKMVLATWRYA